MSVRRDVLYAFRKSIRNPGLTAILLLLLALGIGTITVVFSLYSTVALRPLPVENPGELFAVYTSGSSGKPYSSSSYPDFVDIRDNNRIFSDMLAYQTRQVNAGNVDGTERIEAELVTGNYFDLLGVNPWRGRLFSTDDVAGSGSAPVVVLGHDYWQRRFSADPAALGSTLKLNGQPLTVIGVTPPGFRGVELPTNPGVFLPLAMADQVLGGDRLSGRDSRWIDVVGRLAPGVTEEQATQRIGELFANLSAEHQATNEERRMSLLPIQEATIFPPDREETLDLFAIILVSVLLLLAAVVTNVSSILLARGLARQREMAVNLSLGAGRPDLLRQNVVEAVLLALAGGALALPVVFWVLRLLSSIELPISYPLSLEFTADWRVFAFAMAFALVLGAVVGLLPALRSLRFDLISQLKEESRGGTARRSKVWGGLVVIQIAAILVLLVTAGLFVRSLQKTSSIDPGFRADHVLLLRIDPRVAETLDQEADPYRPLLDEVRQLPGVVAAAMAMDRPLDGTGREVGLWVPGVSKDAEDLVITGLNLVSPGYFEILDIPLTSGRAFTSRDAPDAPQVALVSHETVERLWPDQPILGATVRVGGPDGTELEIIGVVEDVKTRDLREEAIPHIYVPLAQHPAREVNLVVRTAGDPESLVPDVRRQIAAFDPDIPIYDVSTLRQQIQESLGNERIAAATIGVIGLLSLVVGIFGVFGVITYTVHRRNREFGVRMSLGAARFDIIRLGLRQALILTGFGLLLGLAGAVAAGRFVESHLFGVGALDYLTFGVVALLLAATVIAASLPPILRAASVEPHNALHQS